MNTSLMDHSFKGSPENRKEEDGMNMSFENGNDTTQKVEKDETQKLGDELFDGVKVGPSSNQNVFHNPFGGGNPYAHDAFA